MYVLVCKMEAGDAGGDGREEEMTSANATVSCLEGAINQEDAEEER